MSCAAVLPSAWHAACRGVQCYAGCTACVYHRCPNSFLPHSCPAALLQTGADFEVVNVLDDVYNPGLREAIKTYSAWPTIPQASAGASACGCLLRAGCCEAKHQHASKAGRMVLACAVWATC